MSRPPSSPRRTLCLPRALLYPPSPPHPSVAWPPSSLSNALIDHRAGERAIAGRARLGAGRAGRCHVVPPSSAAHWPESFPALLCIVWKKKGEKHMLQMFQIFHRYVASVSYECYKSRSGCFICSNGCTRMFKLPFFNVSSAFSDACCKCGYLDVAYVFTHMLQVFYLDVAYVCNDFQMFFMCFCK
jgi:hypothetical protein